MVMLELLCNVNVMQGVLADNLTNFLVPISKNVFLAHLQVTLVESIIGQAEGNQVVLDMSYWYQVA